MITLDIRRLFSETVLPERFPLIAGMRFFIEPEVSCSRFFSEACYTSPSVQTELGDFLSQRIQGSIFIDVPCGLLSAREKGKDVDLLPLVAALGAAATLEVDISAEVIGDRISKTIDVTAGGTAYLLPQMTGEIAQRLENGYTVFTVQDDLLGLVSKLSTPDVRSPVVVYLSALQPDAASLRSSDWQSRVAVPYLMELYEQIARALGPKDTLILNSAAMLTAGIDEVLFPEVDAAVSLFQRGFTLVRRCRYDKVHVYVKS